MSGKIHITSFAALEHLDAVLGAFSQELPGKIQAVNFNLQLKLAAVEDRCHRLENEICYWENEYEQAGEDDDTNYYSYKQQEAEEKLQQARSFLRNVVEASENFARCARRVNIIADERMNEARGFLKQKLKDLNEYASTNLSDFDNSFASLPNPKNCVNNSTSNKQQKNPLSLSNLTVEDLENIPLPKGFKWLQLDDISPKEIENLPDLTEFRKVTYAEMKSGLEKFESEILPIFQTTPENSNADYFEDLDEKAENNETNSLRKIFNVFFDRQISKEFIKVEKFADEAKYSSITNGRHRIKVAKDLGWKFIPAEVTETNRKR